MFRTFNLGNILVGAGLVGLAVSFFVPSWSAQRIVRVEGRAEEVARMLHAAVAEHRPADLASPPAIAALAAELTSRYAARGFPASDAPVAIEREPPAAVFGTRHYLFRVVERPFDPARDDDPNALRPLEVYAWPRTTLPPGRTVFYVPTDGAAAFSRNLSAGYAGLDRMPPPGAALPRDPGNGRPAVEAYRSNDNERWILLP